MRLPAASLSLLERGMNGYVALDPEFPPRLDALHGKTLRLEIAGMDLDVYIGVAQRHITLRQFHPDAADVEVRATPLGLLSLLRTDDPMAAVQEGAVELRGDVQLARRFKKIFDSLDIDWEEKLSRVIGDWPAHQAGIAAGRLDRWRRRSDDSLSRTMGEYLQEEARLLPARIEVENFIADVDALREAADRLEARLNLMRPKGRGV